MEEPVWVLTSVVMAIHGQQLAEHGGLPGVRDKGALESALARPQNLFAYGMAASIAHCAAAYAFGLARNHAFTDGNKRTSFVVTDLFLARNGYELPQDDDVNIAAWMALAAGETSEADFAAWLWARICGDDLIEDRYGAWTD